MLFKTVKSENGEKNDLTHLRTEHEPQEIGQSNIKSRDGTVSDMNANSKLSTECSQHCSRLTTGPSSVIKAASESKDPDTYSRDSTVKLKSDADVVCQNDSLDKMTKHLLKRIRTLQGKQIQRHIDKQLRIFVEKKQSEFGIPCQKRVSVTTSRNSELVKGAVDHVKTTGDKVLTPEEMRSMSCNALVDLVSKMSPGQMSDFNKLQSLPQITTQAMLLNESTQTTDGSLNILDKCSTQQFNVDLENSQVSHHEDIGPLKATVGVLKSNLCHMENGFDSDATESSSGGESCDELENYDYFKKHSSHFSQHGSSNAVMPVKRASWKWCMDRGSVACRWTWLQAQVADLEFKIRQQNEMYRQLRASKGAITFGGREVIVNSCASVPNSNVVPNQSNSPNLKNSSEKLMTTSDESSHCVRTLPLKQMRKRKMVRSFNTLQGATRKIARYSNVQCDCICLPSIVMPCVLCNGRYNYVQVIDTDCMPQYERIGLLDLSFHPVLSLSNDVSLGHHLSKLLKKETVQKPVNNKQFNKKRRCSPTPSSQNSKFGLDSKHKKSQSQIQSNKVVKKYEKEKRKHTFNSSHDEDVALRKGSSRYRNDSSSNGSTENSRRNSPVPSPTGYDINGSHPSAHLHRRRRSEQHAYDINNIVIPYSIASTTRVEKLQYKEILTPKWRVRDFPPLSGVPKVDNEFLEDISDDIYTYRHQKCEVEERKRFSCVLKGPMGVNQTSQRGRSNRNRLDSSKSDSNNCKTSNSEAPLQFTDTSSQDSFCATPNNMTPPATPSLHTNSECFSESVHGTPANRVADRKRTTSSSSRRDDSVDEDLTPESIPFEKRIFPLSDNEYAEIVKKSVDLYDDEKENQVKSKEEPKPESVVPTPVEPIAETKVLPSRPTTPHSELSSSGSNEVNGDDERADPEWEPKV